MPKTLGVRGTAQEFATLVEDVKDHALKLNLLGTYLRDAHTCDIRKRDLVKREEYLRRNEKPRLACVECVLAHQRYFRANCLRNRMKAYCLQTAPDTFF
jgi:hypothetical protein